MPPACVRTRAVCLLTILTGASKRAHTPRSHPSLAPSHRHHDRCGRRLKCFIFASEVSPEAHPPRIVPGTHTMLYYNYDAFPASRFSEAYVRQQYPEPVAFVGGVGEGFCFDTNSIHQGTLTGSKTRDALILEFHDKRKVAAYHEGGALASSACKASY